MSHTHTQSNNNPTTKNEQCLSKTSNNNTPGPDSECIGVGDHVEDRNFLLRTEDDDGTRDWKSDRGSYFGDEEEYRMRFPWKRIAYIGVLLMLGITCAVLALMKLCGRADWMNTATFSVIVMGSVMLLPPGLYYGRILICICCHCKEYNLWDVPVGPFG